MAIEFVLDTGFDGEIGLSPETLAQLGARRSHTEDARLADGSVIQVDVFEVDLEWDGRWTTVYAEALGSALIGTRLCEGYRLDVEFETGRSFGLEATRAAR